MKPLPAWVAPKRSAGFALARIITAVALMIAYAVIANVTVRAGVGKAQDPEVLFRLAALSWAALSLLLVAMKVGTNRQRILSGLLFVVAMPFGIAALGDLYDAARDVRGGRVQVMRSILF